MKLQLGIILNNRLIELDFRFKCGMGTKKGPLKNGPFSLMLSISDYFLDAQKRRARNVAPA